MNKHRTIILAVISLLFSHVPEMLAQDVDAPLTSQEKSAVIDSIANQLKDNYIFPEIAEKIVEKINENQKSRIYELIDNPKEFANKLTEDLQSVSQDKHLNVSFNPKIISTQKRAV